MSLVMRSMPDLKVELLYFSVVILFTLVLYAFMALKSIESLHQVYGVHPFLLRVTFSIYALHANYLIYSPFKYSFLFFFEKFPK